MDTIQPVTVVWDHEQPVDHAGAPVAPLTPAACRTGGDSDSPAAACTRRPPTKSSPRSSTTTPSHRPTTRRSRVVPVRRGRPRRPGPARLRRDSSTTSPRPCAGLLDPAAEQTMQRSAGRGPDQPPITVDDCPDWDHQVPMICSKTCTTRRSPPGSHHGATSSSSTPAWPTPTCSTWPALT